MRSRTGVVDPTETDWDARQPAAELDRGAPREQVAAAHEVAYRREHASWAPATERPLAESLEVFCGESWLPETALLAEHGVASLHGPPLAPAEDELFLIAGTTRPDEPLLRALVAAQLAGARRRGARLSIEADVANPELWTILAELPATLEPDVLLVGTGAAAERLDGLSSSHRGERNRT